MFKKTDNFMLQGIMETTLRRCSAKRSGEVSKDWGLRLCGLISNCNSILKKTMKAKYPIENLLQHRSWKRRILKEAITVLNIAFTCAYIYQSLFLKGNLKKIYLYWRLKILSKNISCCRMRIKKSYLDLFRYTYIPT